MPFETYIPTSSQVIAQEMTKILRKLTSSRTYRLEEHYEKKYFKACYYKAYNSDYDYDKSFINKIQDLQLEISHLKNKIIGLTKKLLESDERNFERQRYQRKLENEKVSLKASLTLKQSELDQLLDSNKTSTVHLKGDNQLGDVSYAVKQFHSRYDKIEAHAKEVFKQVERKRGESGVFTAAWIILLIVNIILGGILALPLLAPAVGAGFFTAIIIGLAGTALVFALALPLAIGGHAEGGSAILGLIPLVAIAGIIGGFFLYPFILAVLPAVSITSAVVIGICAIPGIYCFIKEREINAKIDNDDSIFVEIFRNGIDSLEPAKQEVNSEQIAEPIDSSKPVGQIQKSDKKPFSDSANATFFHTSSLDDKKEEIERYHDNPSNGDTKMALP